LEHRREILRPIDFGDAYSNTNCNSDCNCDCHRDCNAERDSETYADAKG
jgi:hypothetical protein